MERLKIVISDVCVGHYYFLDSNKVNEGQKEFFKQMAYKSSGMGEIQNNLITLVKMLKSHYEKPVILLIDEYSRCKGILDC